MKKFFFLAVLAATLFCVDAIAVSTQVIVLQRDTLWGITEATGQSGWQWPKLWEANPGLPQPQRMGNWEVVWIYPGQILNLPEGWGTDRINRTILQPVNPDPLEPSWLERIQEWVKSHPWVWGLLGLLGLLGLFGLRGRRAANTAIIAAGRTIIVHPDGRVEIR